MYKVYNIEDFNDNASLFIYLIDEIYKTSKILNNQYPNYKNWYYDTQIEGIENGRTILFVLNNKNKIIGICHLKRKENEKKICFLYIDSNYKDMGIDNLLLKETFDYLSTYKPAFSIYLNDYNTYKNIIDKYKWKLHQINSDCKLYYNGKSKKKIK